MRHGVRPGSDDAHAALHDIDELRQLVERGPAHECPEPGHALVGLAALPDGVTVFGDGHGAELVDDDFFAVEAVAALPEDRRPGCRELDRQREQQEQRRGQCEDEERQDDIARALDQAVDAGKRRIADPDDRHAAHRVYAPLDQIGDEHVGDEIHRGSRVAQRFEQRQDARLRSHRQRQIDEVDAVFLDELRQLLNAAQHRKIIDLCQAVARAIIDEADHVDARIAIGVQAPGQFDTGLVHPREDRALAPALELADRRSDASQQQHRADLAGERHPPPRDQRATIEILQQVARVAEEEKQPRQREPPHHEALDRAMGRLRQPRLAREGQRKNDDCQDHVRRAQLPLDEQRHGPQRQHQDERLERHLEHVEQLGASHRHAAGPAERDPCRHLRHLSVALRCFVAA